MAYMAWWGMEPLLGHYYTQYRQSLATLLLDYGRGLLYLSINNFAFFFRPSFHGSASQSGLQCNFAIA